MLRSLVAFRLHRHVRIGEIGNGPTSAHSQALGSSHEHLDTLEYAKDLAIAKKGQERFAEAE